MTESFDRKFWVGFAFLLFNFDSGGFGLGWARAEAGVGLGWGGLGLWLGWRGWGLVWAGAGTKTCRLGRLGYGLGSLPTRLVKLMKMRFSKRSSHNFYLSCSCGFRV